MKKVIFLVLALGLVFSLSACSKKNDNLNLKNGSAEESELFSGSLKDLIARGKDLKCTYLVSDISGQGQMTGTTYISGKKYFSEFEFKGSHQQTKVNTLFDGEYIYTWSSMMKNGTKMNLEKIKEISDDEESGEEYRNFSKNYDEDYNYKCTKWKKDESRFQVPSDIEFTDLTIMITGITGDMESGDTTGGSSSLESMCAMCDIIPDEEGKKECLVNLGCE
ncbi:hypothetical protein K8R66_03750 [bacterium]|nr:hypothetical protein [bacterium]